VTDQFFTAVKRSGPSGVAAWVSHVLAWVAGIVLLILPVNIQGLVPIQVIQRLAPIQANGPWDLLFFPIPVILTGAVLVAIFCVETGNPIRSLLFLPSLSFILMIALVSIPTIGPLYVPTAVTMLAAAILDQDVSSRIGG
jgi:hypothetical protein